MLLSFPEFTHGNVWLNLVIPKKEADGSVLNQLENYYSNISHDYPLTWLMTSSCNETTGYLIVKCEKTKINLSLTDCPLVWMTCSSNRAVQNCLLSTETIRLKLHCRRHKTYKMPLILWVYSYFCFKLEIKQIATFKTHVPIYLGYTFHNHNRMRALASINRFSIDYSGTPTNMYSMEVNYATTCVLFIVFFSFELLKIASIPWLPQKKQNAKLVKAFRRIFGMSKIKQG